MSQTHESIVDKVILQWSRENRGRLFKNHNGKAYIGKKKNEYFENDKRIIILEFASIISYGIGTGTSDLIGWEMVKGMPLICGVEVKTKSSPKVTPDQRKWLNNLVNIGGRAYLVRENNNGYNIAKWIKK